MLVFTFHKLNITDQMIIIIDYWFSSEDDHNQFSIIFFSLAQQNS